MFELVFSTAGATIVVAIAVIVVAITMIILRNHPIDIGVKGYNFRLGRIKLDF
jgi:hypothetical protein